MQVVKIVLGGVQGAKGPKSRHKSPDSGQGRYHSGMLH